MAKSPLELGIEAILFDHHDVLGGPGPSYKEVSRELNLQEPFVKKALEVLLPELQEGRISEEDFWTKFYRRFGKEVTGISRLYWVELGRKYELLSSFYPWAVDLVNGLGRKGYIAGLASDTIKPLAGINRGNGLYGHFGSNVFLSCELGARKSEPGFFKTCCDDMGLENNHERVLFIDKEKKNIDAAKREGLKALTFKNEDQLYRDLERLGIKYK